jgi:hypothetical protein
MVGNQRHCACITFFTCPHHLHESNHDNKDTAHALYGTGSHEQSKMQKKSTRTNSPPGHCTLDPACCSVHPRSAQTLQNISVHNECNPSEFDESSNAKICTKHALPRATTLLHSKMTTAALGCTTPGIRITKGRQHATIHRCQAATAIWHSYSATQQHVQKCCKRQRLHQQNTSVHLDTTVLTCAPTCT